MSLTVPHLPMRIQRTSGSVLQISFGERVVGFVEKVGMVYVSLLGARYDTATEVGQSMDADSAGRAVVRAAEL